MNQKPEPGETVRALPPCDGSTWRVVVCTCELCERGRHVAVNEPSLAETPESRPRWRHVSFRNLERLVLPPGAVLSDEDAPPTVPQ